VLGLYSCAPPLYATARPLPGEEAGRVAGKLARKYPARRRFPLRLLYRTGRWQMVHYELLAHERMWRELVNLARTLAPVGAP
jgi:hypothetical protein